MWKSGSQRSASGFRVAGFDSARDQVLEASHRGQGSSVQGKGFGFRVLGFEFQNFGVQALGFGFRTESWKPLAEGRAAVWKRKAATISARFLSCVSGVLLHPAYITNKV